MERRDFIKLAAGGFAGISLANATSAKRLLRQLGVEKVATPVSSASLLNHLAGDGINKDYVEKVSTFNKAHPTAEVFRDRLTGRTLHEFHGLKRAREDDGTLIVPTVSRGLGKYTINNNVFEGDIEDSGRVAFNFTGDSGAETFVIIPELWLGPVPQNIVSGPILNAIDPQNSYYKNNVIDWNYGPCIRRIRIIEGRMYGSWIFPANPGNNVTIIYNREGRGFWRLGEYQFGADKEFISKAVFAEAKYPFTIRDEFVPAAGQNSPVDGVVFRSGQVVSWTTIHTTANGTTAGPSTAEIVFSGWRFETSPNFDALYRSYFLFDTSALTEAPGSATFNIWFTILTDQTTGSPNVLVYNLYSGVPTGDADIVVADYNKTKFGTTPWTNDLAVGDITTGQYNAMTINATGLSNISTSSLTRFGFRDKNHDAADVKPSHTGAVDGNYQTATGYTTDQGASNDPTLITDAAAGGPASVAGITGTPASVAGLTSRSKTAGIE